MKDTPKDMQNHVSFLGTISIVLLIGAALGSVWVIGKEDIQPPGSIILMAACVASFIAGIMFLLAMSTEYIYSLKAHIQRLEETIETMVPISADGKLVFIDGPGVIPLDFERAKREQEEILQQRNRSG